MKKPIPLTNSDFIIISAVVFALFIACSVLGYLIYSKVKKKSAPFLAAGKLNAYLSLAFITAGLGLVIFYSFKFSDRLLPDLASEHGASVDNILWVTLLPTGIVFFLTQILLFYFAFRYKASESRKPKFYTKDFKLELAWTLIPMLTFVGLFVYGQASWSKITRDPRGKAVDIEIMGEQFNWRVRYPGADGKLGTYNFRLIDEINDFGLDMKDPANYDDFTPFQIHIPKGREVVFRIRSRDVIHSVFLPHFRLKMDAIPGMPTQFHFVPTVTTEEMRKRLGNPNFNYELACAELCGRNHFAMLFIVVVDEEEDYEKWFSSQIPWLAKHKEYLAKVPAKNKDYARQVIANSIPDKAKAVDKKDTTALITANK